MASADILFRTDASPLIGAGHLMRCLALANALQAQGARCGFLIRLEALGDIGHLIESQGHQLLGLQGSTPLRNQQNEDAALCQRLLACGSKARWLIVDHYSLDAAWERAMQGVANELVVIDDLADREHVCSVLLDQNLSPRMELRYKGLLPDGCHQLLGPRFALLRPEFAGPHDRSPTTGIQPRLLVMFGSADPKALTLRVLKVLVHWQWTGEIDVVVGSLFGQFSALGQLIPNLTGARLHVAPQNIAELMLRADLAIGSPGVSSWERCCVGLPALAISQAANQEELGKALADAGAHLYLGNLEDLSDNNLEAALRVLLANAPLRNMMSRISRSLCDGKGAERVARQLWQRPLNIRPAEMRDALMLFQWRNDARTRRYANNPAPLHWDSHTAWIQGVLSSNDEILLIAEQSEAPTACIRFSCHEEYARISIYTDPDLQGGGIGSLALNNAICWLGKNRPEILVVEADVLQNNIASHTMFRNNGFTQFNTQYRKKLGNTRQNQNIEPE